MAQYQYTVRAFDSTNERFSSTCYADSESVVRSGLKRMGYKVESIIPRKSSELFGQRKRIKLKDLVNMCRRFSIMYGAGISLLDCLAPLAKENESKKLSEALQDIHDRIEQGSNVADAFSRHQDAFSPLFINLLRAGEKAGEFDYVLGQLSMYLEQEYELKKRIRQALAYPCVVVIMIFLVVTMLVIVVVPTFAEVYVKLGITLPLTSSRFRKDTFLKQKVDTENTRRAFEDIRKFGTELHQPEHLLFRDYRDVKVLGLHEHVYPMQWHLCAEIDAWEALAPLARMKLIFIIIFCAVPVIVWTVGTLVSRFITAPIYTLHEGTEKIGRGNLDCKVGTNAKDEIGQLSRAFDQMTTDLKKTTTSRDELNAVNQKLLIREQQLSVALSGMAVLLYQICFWLKQGYWKPLGSRLIWDKVLPASFFQWLHNPNSLFGLNKIISLVFNSPLALFLFVFSLVVFLLVNKISDLFSKPEKKEQVGTERWRSL